MPRGGVITGTIVDGDDRPVTVTGVLYVYPSGTDAGGRGTSIVMAPGDGTFRLGPLDSGSTYDILANAFKGYMQHTVESVAAGSDQVVLRLTRAGTIAGRVLDETGSPAPYGTPVRASAVGVAPTRKGASWTAYTKQGGKFMLNGLGDHTFRLVAGGGESGMVCAGEVSDIRIGTKDVELAVSRGAALTGRLIDAQGRPVKTHYLAALPTSAQNGAWTRVSDDEGRFTLRGLPKGKVQLGCYVGDEYVKLGEFDAPAKDVEVKLPE